MDFDLRKLLRKFYEIGDDSFKHLSDGELRYLVNKASQTLIRRNSPRMKYWIVSYQHRHGTDHYIHYSAGQPSLSDIIPHHYEGHRSDEYLDLSGPYEMWDPAQHGDQPNFHPTSDFGLFFKDTPEDPKYPFPDSGLSPENYGGIFPGDDYARMDVKFDECPACSADNITAVPEDEGFLLYTCGECSFFWAQPG